MIGDVLRVRFELTQLLSEGPIFTAYAAKDRVEEGEVCVRMIRMPYASDPAFVARLREVIAKQDYIDHAGVENLRSVDEEESPFLVSSLTNGVPLAERIRKLAPFSVPVAVSTAISLCEGLEAIHSAGLVHGDVSAQNVAALPDGQVRLQLPGVWEAYSANSAAGAVLPGMAPYLAPEISAGAMPTATSDVYACGVLLYELLTGRYPYNADTPVSMALKHATGTVPSVRMYNPSVPAVLDEIVKKALAKEPERRYASAGALLADLRVLQDALRFGRTVTWPITPEAPSVSPDPMPKTVSMRKEPLTSQQPRMRRDRQPADVPLFLIILITVFGAAAVTMLGIWVVFNVNKPSQVKVPNIVNQSVTQARDLLRQSKLHLEVVQEQPSEQVPTDDIISSDPPAGERIREGGKVLVTVSSGSKMVRVPNLKGNAVDQARSILKSARLDLDDNIEQQRSRTVDTGLVISQDPSSGRKLEQGGKVKIVVSAGKLTDGNPDEATSNTTPPETTGKSSLYTLRVKLSGLDHPVTLRVDLVDDRGTRTVYEQPHDPNETVELATRGTGAEVVFRIYYDDELVKEVKQRADQRSGGNAP